MKRLDYETLAMEEVAVEMEYGFLTASMYEKTGTETTGHELNDIAGSTFDVTGENGNIKDGNGWE